MESFCAKNRRKALLTRLFTGIILVLASGNLFGQLQNNQWRFGTTGAIDFNTVPPSFVAGCLISTGEGSASIADRTTGALLFYTDGVTVWNANNQVMPNGTGLLGGVTLSSTTAAVIVPKPGSNDLYYIITIDEQGSNNGVRYNVVDMSLNGGLGDVVAGQKNILLVQTTSEKLEVVPASDGISYWLITHDNPGNGFLSFKIDNSGIQTTPVVSLIGGVHGNGSGHMKINKQFNKIALGLTTLGSGSTTTIELFDFNNTTGVISNAIIWNYTIQVTFIYGVEFSPNGKILYVSDLQNLVQYDITQPTPLAIENSAYQVSTGVNTSLQLGIDDKIYVNSGSLNAINCPNKLGADCGYQTNVIANQTAGGGYGLPKWVYYQNDTGAQSSNAIVFNENCFGANTEFFLQNTSGISNITWDFGDPNSGANNTAVGYNVNHTFSQLDVFNVQAILTTACGFDTLSTGVAILNPCNSQVEQCDIYLYTGTAQTWTVPAGVDSITVKMWGAGGGGGPDSTNNAGGGGGYTEFSLPVIPGDILAIVVGNGGQEAIGNTGGDGGWPSGGDGGDGNRNEEILGIPTDLGGAGGGGGISAIRMAGSINQLLAIAGGGGGGAYNRAGGGGGGLQAEYTEASNLFNVNGFGGSQTAGGAPGNNSICPPPVSGQPGISLAGGDGANGLAVSNTGGGGGGDGYFGGGGGSSHDGCFEVGSTGGGGSGYLCTTCPGLTGFTQTAGFFGEPANNSDPILASYPGTATGLNGQNGGGGLVQICFFGACQASFASFDTTVCTSFTNELGTTFDSSGTYSYTLFSESGCDSIVSFDLTIRPVPLISASATSGIIALGDTVQLSATGASSYVWSPTESLSCSDCASPLAFPLQATTYTVLGTDSFGCRVSDTVIVDIRCNEPFIPTIFSPNNKGNQVNETFCIFSDCVEQFKLVIHNRWGEKVFEKEDITQCWDGFFDENEAATGVYAYNLYIRQSDGTVINKTGTITLIR